MKPLLAHVYSPRRMSFPCWGQPKLNGVRALYQGGHFQSRELIPWDKRILAHIGEQLQSVLDPSVVLDGELYVHGWLLQRINGAVTPVRANVRVDTTSVEYHVFDRVSFTQSFEKRFWSLPHSSFPLPHVHLVETHILRSPLDADLYYAHCVERGYEGTMYRLGDCPYTTPRQTALPPTIKPHGLNLRARFLSDQDNRCWHLLKRKDWQDDEFEFVDIVGTIGDKGEPGFQLTLRSKSATIPHFHVGSGLSRAEVQHYIENPPVGRLCKIKYLTLSSDGIPQNPTLLAIL